MKKALFLFGVLVGAVVLLSACEQPTELTFYVAIDDFDLPDANPGDGLCRTAANFCNLRAAIDEANANPDVVVNVVLSDNGDWTLLGGVGDDDNEFGDLDIKGSVRLTVDHEFGSDSTIDGSGADRVFDVHEGGSLWIEDVQVTGGDAGVGSGGGIRSLGALVLVDATVEGNTAGSGGGVSVEGGTALIGNSTISGNTSTTGTGGGLVNEGAAVDVLYSTIAANEGGGVFTGPTAIRTKLGATIVADQTLGADCAGEAPESATYNLDTDGSCLPVPQAGDRPGAVAALAPLADIGGPTATHDLESASEAIDQVPLGVGLCGQVGVDQRGVDRPVGSACDIGAVETLGCLGHLVPGADLRFCDLSGVDLSGLDLHGVDLENANLTGADLDGTDLTGADLLDVVGFADALNRCTATYAGARLVRLDFSGCDLSGRDFSSADLSRADLDGADLSSADFSGVNLDDAELHGVDVTGANFTNARLGVLVEPGGRCTATYTGADLHFLDSVIPPEAPPFDLSDCDLSGASLAGVRGIVDFTGADLTGADLTGAVLGNALGWPRGSVLIDASIGGLDLEGADLTNVDLRDSVGLPVNRTSATKYSLTRCPTGVTTAFSGGNCEGNWLP